MTHLLASTTRLLAAGIVTLVVAAACGGRSFDGDDGVPSGAGKGAGASSQGGSAAGGSGAAGGNSAAGGTLGIGWPKECSDPPEQGPCNAYNPRWYLDIATGICKPFIYGGCQGNDNNYESLAACQKACANTNPSYDHCEVASDCVLGAPDCCGVCDGSGVTAHSFMAYNRQYEASVRPYCSLNPCGGCVDLPVLDGQIKYFVPDCVNHQCTIVDLRQSPITACTSDQDCFIRYGTGCCPGCASSERVGISNDDLLIELVCGADSDCPAVGCDLAPDGAVAYCNAGHCAIKLAN